MILTEVYPENQLIWADAVPCEKSSAGYRPKSDLGAPFDSSDALRICFLNEDRLRCARYEILHYNIKDYHDDGPPALDQIVEACRLIEDGLQAKRQVVVYVPEGAQFKGHRSFSALCVAAHRVLARREGAAQAIAPWQTGGPAGSSVAFFVNSWASKKMTAPKRSLTLELCVRTIEVARDRGWIDLASFDSSKYLDLWRQYDLSWIVPGELQVLGDPVSTVEDPDPATVGTIEPQEGKDKPSFVSYFLENSVKLIIRLNLMSEPGLKKSYEPAVFTKHSISCLDASYDDINGGVPSKQILKKILAKCGEFASENQKAAVAFHCKAGFGRSVVCAATWLIYHHDLPGEVAYTWSRLCRPGSITTPQQAQFLQGLQGKSGVEEDVLKPEGCCTVQ